MKEFVERCHKTAEKLAESKEELETCKKVVVLHWVNNLALSRWEYQLHPGPFSASGWIATHEPLKRFDQKLLEETIQDFDVPVETLVGQPPIDPQLLREVETVFDYGRWKRCFDSLESCEGFEQKDEAELLLEDFDEAQLVSFYLTQHGVDTSRLNGELNKAVEQITFHGSVLAECMRNKVIGTLAAVGEEIPDDMEWTIIPYLAMAKLLSDGKEDEYER